MVVLNGPPCTAAKKSICAESAKRKPAKRRELRRTDTRIIVGGYLNHDCCLGHRAKPPLSLDRRSAPERWRPRRLARRRPRRRPGKTPNVVLKPVLPLSV